MVRCYVRSVYIFFVYGWHVCLYKYDCRTVGCRRVAVDAHTYVLLHESNVIQLHWRLPPQLSHMYARDYENQKRCIQLHLRFTIFIC